VLGRQLKITDIVFDFVLGCLYLFPRVFSVLCILEKAKRRRTGNQGSKKSGLGQRHIQFFTARWLVPLPTCL